MRAVGIDLGVETLHAVALTTSREPFECVDALVVPPSELRELIDFCAEADTVAIDAPDAVSTEPHQDDRSLSTKFRVARCCEIALGQQFGAWVPWVTPPTVEESPGWMRVGYSVWSALRDEGHGPMEVYPSAAFTALAGERLPKKTRYGGLVARWAVLTPHVKVPPMAAMWSHDGLDALVAALIAAWGRSNRVRAAMHTHPGADGSAIWVPANAAG